MIGVNAMYAIGDKILHPMHGAGIIDNIVTKSVGKDDKQYYVLKLSANKMMVMVPVNSSDDIGVRPIICSKKADEIIEYIKHAQVEFDANWNSRYRENMIRIKSGEITEVAKVVKVLSLRDREKGLSTGERKMLHSAKQILISEIVLAKSEDYIDVELKITRAIIA